MKTPLALSLVTASVATLMFSSCSSGSGGGGSAPAALSGTVLDSSSPVSGALITIEELGLTTRTNSDGFFSFGTVTGGTYTVKVDGETVFDPDNNSKQIARKAVIEFPSVTINGTDVILNGRPIFLPTLSEGVQIDTSGTNMATIPAGTVIGSNDLGATLVFEQPTTVTFADPTDTTISVSRVQIEAIPMNLPAGQISSSVVTLQPPGTTFSPAVKVVFPNDNALSAGTTGVPLYRFDHDIGAWAQFGTGTVDAAGETVVSNADSGLDESGWNGPTNPVVGFTTVRGRVVDGANPTVGVAGILCTTVNGLQATTAADGTFEILQVPLPRVGFSALVNAAPVLKNSGFKAKNSTSVIAVQDGVTQFGDIALDADPVDVSAPTVVSVVPADAATDVEDTAVVRVTFNETVSPGSLNVQSFAVAFDGTAIAGQFGVDDTVVTFVPDAPMPLGSTGTITLSTGIEDASGNGLATAVETSFTTSGDATGNTAMVTVTGTASLQEAQTTRLDGALLDPSGMVVNGATFTWATSDAAVASVSNSGIVTARTAGSATITATSGTTSGMFVVTVTAAPVATVVVAPSSQTLVTNGLRQFVATARDSGGGDIPGLAFGWTSSDTAVATVTANGTVTGVAAGSATITATSNTIMGTATVTVVDLASVTSILVTPAISELDLGASMPFTAIARNMSGDSIPGVPFTWTSSTPAVATISPAFGQATAVAAGTTTITATSGLIAGTATLNVAQPTTLTVALTGGKNRGDPIANARVFRNDPTTGAFIEEVTSNASGIATFGDIGAATTSITVFLQDQNDVSFFSLPGIATGTYSLALAGPVATAATFDVSLTGAGMSANTSDLVVGDYQQGECYPATITNGIGTAAGVIANRLEQDGRFSMLAVAAQAGTAITGTGWALDLLPSEVNMMNVPIDLSHAPVMIPFTSDANIRQDGYALRRGESLFDVALVADNSATMSGMIPVAPMPGTDGWEMLFRTGVGPQDGFCVSKFYQGSLPSSIAITVPQFSLSALTYDTMTRVMSWTAAGSTANVDLASVCFEYFETGQEGAVSVEWEVLATAADGSFVMPELPSNLSSFVPGSGASFELELVDFDNITGFAAAVTRLQSIGGDRSLLGFTTGEIKAAFRNNSQQF